MTKKTAACIFIDLSWVLWFLAACVQASERPVKALADHLAESGIPTEREVARVEGSLKTIIDGQNAKTFSQAWFDGWIGARLPFSFRYGGKEFTGNDSGWRFQAGAPHRQSDVETRDLTWSRPETGLKVVWHIRRFLNYPAVDSLLTFENAGGKDTPLIENVSNLDLKLNQTQPGEKKTYTVHGCHGGRCGEDDLMPFTRTVTTAPDGPNPTLTLLRQDYEKLEIDKSVVQTPLTIGDRKFEHGLGTHSVSRIRIHSPKPIERVTAWVGVDHNERTRNGAGSVVFSVATKQGRLFQSKTLRGGQAPVRIDLDTRGATTLDLNVDDAGDGPACDHADWADAAITLRGGQTVRLDELARGDGAFDAIRLAVIVQQPGVAVLQHRDSRRAWRARRPGMERQLAGFVQGAWHATECRSGHANNPFPSAPRRESPRAARAAGVLERPPTAWKQYAAARAL